MAESKNGPSVQDSPEVSVIVRTFNESKHLPRLLDCLESQTHPSYEVLVVDSGSFDGTRELAETRGHRVLRIRSEDFTFGHALNVGIRQARGRYLAIVSAHTAPLDAAWLDCLTRPLKNPDVAMVYGRQVGAEQSKFGERQDLQRTFGLTPRTLVPPDFFANNANSAIRRDLWLEHPFDESLPGLEDIEWCKFWLERGFSARYEPAAALIHIHEESWAQVRRRYYREAMAAKWIGIRGRRDIPGVLAGELGALGRDGWQALRELSHRRLGEIVRFRFEKTLGTVKGLWDAANVHKPFSRRDMFFESECAALVVHGPGRAEVGPIRLPQLAPGEVLVKVAFAGMCATDIEVIDGTLGYYKNGLAHYPIVPGHEFSGTIGAVGSRVTGLAEGDRVVVECIQGCGECDACRRENTIACSQRREVGVMGRNGGFAEYMITPARFVHPVPATVSLLSASLCEPLAVVMKGLRRMKPALGSSSAGRRIAVVGVGPIGHLSARVLDAEGYAVTVFDHNEARLATFAGSRIQTSTALDQLVAFDGIVEATGDPDSLDAILHRSSAGVVILLLGLPYAKRDFSFEAIVGYDKTVVGSVGSTAADFDEAIRVLPGLDLSAFEPAVKPLAEVASALRLARSRQHLKVTLQADRDLPSSEASLRPLSAHPVSAAV